MDDPQTLCLTIFALLSIYLSISVVAFTKLEKKCSMLMLTALRSFWLPFFLKLRVCSKVGDLDYIFVLNRFPHLKRREKNPLSWVCFEFVNPALARTAIPPSTLQNASVIYRHTQAIRYDFRNPSFPFFRSKRHWTSFFISQPPTHSWPPLFLISLCDGESVCFPLSHHKVVSPMQMVYFHQSLKVTI